MKICLLGASFNTGNMGVNALAESAIKCIRHRWPEAEVMLLGSGREVGEERLIIQGRQLHMNTLPLRFCRNVFMAEHFCVLSGCALLLKVFRTERAKRLLCRHNWYLKEILECDLAADITGGDSFSDIYGMKRFVLGYLEKWLMVLFDKPLVLLPQTYGPYKRRITRLLAGNILKRSKVVYARDHAGIEYLRQTLNGENVNGKIRFAPDVAFVLDPRKPDSSGIDPVFDGKTNQTVVGLNISGLLFNGGYTRDNMFGLAVDYRELMTSVIDFFLAEENVRVVLIPHVFPNKGYEVESDAAACRQIHESTDDTYKDRILVTPSGYSHNEIKYFIGRTDFFVGSRMHSCIAAMSQCVPTVGLAYSRKFKGVFETAQMQDFVADMRNCTQRQVLDMISQSFRKRRETARHLAEIMPGIEEKVLDIFRDVA